MIFVNFVFSLVLDEVSNGDFAMGPELLAQLGCVEEPWHLLTGLLNEEGVANL